MSCALHSISQIHNVDKLQSLLKDLAADQQAAVDKGFDNEFVVGEEGVNNWDGDWGSDDDWVADASPVEALSPSGNLGKSWLHTCKLSLSPAGDLIAIAKDDNGIFLTRRWPKETTSSPTIEAQTPSYDITWSGDLTCEENEKVTCINAVPLASQQRSSQGSPDWTCIIAGYSTGYIRMYMSNGSLLLSQFLHDGPVLNIVIRTKTSFASSSDQVDELIILYSKAIVTIDGFSLYQSLRACRNQLAKAQASYGSESIQPPPLAYKKWKSTGQKGVTDCVSCGVTSPCFFDRLQTASVIGGQQATVKGSSPAFNRFLSTGTEPFLCYYQALEGSNQPILSDVAMAYASKLTSAVFSSVKNFTMGSGWFGGGKQAQSPEKKDVRPNVERGTSLPARFGLFDQHRITSSVKLSPIGNLAIVTDTFNRVSLVDISTGIVLRLWKGYRDAECGWIVVEEEEDQQSDAPSLKRRALFVVIYAPKRGILEIYLTEHGARVGAFNVGKNCKLICPTYQCLGQTRATTNINSNEFQQCFLLQEDGSIKTIHVPFHCSLSNVHSIRAKDAHQLKRVATSLDKSKGRANNNEEIVKTMVSIILDIQAPNMQKKAVELMMNTTGLRPKFLESSLTLICDGLQKAMNSRESVEEDLEYQAEKSDLLLYCHAQKHLINLYLAIENIQEDKSSLDSMVTEDLPGDRQQTVAELLHVTGTEAKDFLEMLDRYKFICLDDFEATTKQKHHQKKTTSSKKLDINEFLSCFRIENISHHPQQKRFSKEASSSSSQHFKVILDDKVVKELTLSLGDLFFENTLKGDASISRLAFILESSRIPPKQIMMLLTEYSQSMMNSNVLFKDCSLVLLNSLVSSICALKGGAEKHCVDLPVGEVSDWWQSVRDILSKSILIGQALIMAVICRSVAMEIQTAAQKVKAQDESDIETGGWEAVTVDMEKWNLLVCQLENLIDVDCFIHSNHAKSALSGIESPNFGQRHTHAASKDDVLSKKKLSSDKKEVGGDLVELPVKMSGRLSNLSVQGILENNKDAIPQIIADCLVRQGVPGPCLGTKKPKQSLTFRGRLATVNQGHPSTDVQVHDDVPMETDDQPNNEMDSPSTEQSETLTALIELREKFPYSLEQDRLWTHCVWESIMVWNEDTEDISMLRSALIYLSCIHNAHVQQGLGVMMWKAVFNETIKSALSLMDKVGKAPKDRLCRKTVSLGYKALEEFLGASKKLLEILIDINTPDEAEDLDLKIEDIWIAENSESCQQSIMKQAQDENRCNIDLLNHFWCMVTSLYLIMLGGVRSIKPLSLFDTKGKHAFTFALYSSPVLSNEVDDKINKCRREFCLNGIQCIIKQHIDLTFQDERARNNTSDLLHTMSTIFSLTSAFHLSCEDARQFAACELYRVGLDLAAQEVSMVIEDKQTFSTRMIDVVGGRIAKTLLSGETQHLSDSLSKLPTNISSWLAKLEKNTSNVAELPISKTYLLLQYLNSHLIEHTTKEAKFIKELIECLKVFV